MDITERGDPIFDDDIDLLVRRANNDPARDEILPALDGSNCGDNASGQLLRRNRPERTVGMATSP